MGVAGAATPSESAESSHAQEEAPKTGTSCCPIPAVSSGLASSLIVVSHRLLQLLWNPEPQKPSRLLMQLLLRLLSRHLIKLLIQFLIQLLNQFLVQQLIQQQIQSLIQALFRPLAYRPLVRPLVQLQNNLTQLPQFPMEPPLQLQDFLLEPLMELPVQLLLEPRVELQSQVHAEPQMGRILKNHPEFLVKFLPGVQLELLVKLLVPPTLTADRRQSRTRPPGGATRR